ncbi:hypothetical protein ACROYT_G017077 [Oculina patagonica]
MATYSRDRIEGLKPKLEHHPTAGHRQTAVEDLCCCPTCQWAQWAGFSWPSVASTSQEGHMVVEKSTLKVTLLSSEWRSSTSGDVSTINRELAVQLAKHSNVQVSVFLPQCSEEDKNIATHHKVQLIEAEEMPGVDSVDWLINIPENHAMDCIIGHGVQLGRQIPLIQRNHDCRWVQVVHSAPEELGMYKSNADAIFRGEKLQQTEIELCERADQVVAVGPKLADAYKRYLRAAKNSPNVLELTPSIFTEFLDVKQATEERNTFCVLVIGSGDSEDFNLKGYDLAAQAIAELKEKSYQLRFVCAPGGKGDKIAENLIKHGVARSQLIVRSFNESREMLAKLFCEVDLAIMPSRTEGFGLTALEALSAGLPVLVSGNSGLGEALKKVPTGSNCVVDSEDPKDWAKEIRAVRQKDRKVRLAESKHLREKYLERYSWQEPCGVLLEKMHNLIFVEHSQLPFPAAIQLHAEPTYLRSDHPQSSPGRQPSLVEYTYSQFPSAVASQTHEGPSYQGRHIESSSYQGRAPSSEEYNQLPFTAVTHPQAQTYHTSHPQMEHSQLPFPAAIQHQREPTYLSRCHLQGSPGWLPSSVRYSQFPPAVAGQTDEGPIYQGRHMPSASHHGRAPSSEEYNQLPFTAVTHTPAQTYHTSHPQLEHSQLLFPAAIQIHAEPTYLGSCHLQGSPGWLPSSVRYSQFPPALASQSHEEPNYQRRHTQSSSGHDRPFSLVENNCLPLTAATQIPTQAYQTSHTLNASPKDTFDVKTCKRKLAEHYQRTAKVPTTVWSSVFQVDLDQIYTRLSWIKEEQTPAGSWQKELSHYTELFTEKTKNGGAPKRILVQGETGIGKTTFVKRLLVDWSNLDDAKMEKAEEREDPPNKFNVDECKDDQDVIEDSEESSTASKDTDEGGAKMEEEQKDVLRRFELVLSINLKDISKCQTLREVISHSRLFPEDEEKSTDDLLSYIRNNQEKILLLFDGYDEYRTGSEAEETYGSRSSSPIYRIFQGDILRDCTVLVTTRSSRADEIREPADIQAEITGFNMSDREKFMRKMLGSRTQVNGLLSFLWKSNMEDLSKVPLLTLFFCLLWKEEKEKLMEMVESKTKLFRAITKHILQHSHRKDSPSPVSKLKEENYKEILAEIGKVALEGLLKGDLMFEFGQLPEKVRGEQIIIVGLLQLSEYGPGLEPMEMVSFIHKSIQEYLAAWYITHRCVPEGSLGKIEQHARTLEDCEALENVFQFICGLSDEGALKVFQHLTSVRISDPTLDLSKTIPDVENETDVPLGDVTYRLKRFSNLVYDSFQEVRSKAELLSHCFDCTGRVVLVTRDRPISKLLPKANILTELANYCVLRFERICFYNFEDSVINESLEFLNYLQMPQSIPESRKFFSERDLRFVGKTWLSTACSFSSILCCRNGQFQFYITELFLECDDHARLFTESSVDSVSSSAELLCLKFLSSLLCHKLSGQTVKALGALIRNCKHLKRIEVGESDDSVCDLLEQVPNPSKCILTIADRDTSYSIPSIHLTSAGAVQLARLLPQFHNIITLVLDLSDCCSAAVDTLVTSITHKTLEVLVLSGISLTPAAATALGQSLPKMSSLEVLELTGVDENILEAKEMEALFGGFNKTLPLRGLTFIGVSMRGCLTPLTKSFRFFPNLRKLDLGGFNEEFNMDEQNLCLLLESLRFIPNLKTLSVKGRAVSQAHCCTAEEHPIVSVTHKSLEQLSLDAISLTPAIAAALGGSLPKMFSLQRLELTVVDESILEPKEMEVLFGGFNKTLPLSELTFNGFSVRGCLAPLTKSFCFFPNLRWLILGGFNMDEHNLCLLLESLRFIPNLEILMLTDEPVRQEDSLWPYANPTASDTHKNLEILFLERLRLTPAVAAMLGQSLPEMSSLEDLYLTGVDGSILEAKEMEALFGGFNKTLRLRELTFSGFSVRGCLAPLSKSLQFFPNLRELNLEKLNMDENDLCGLLNALCCTAEESLTASVTLEALEKLSLDGISLTSAVVEALGRSLPEMPSLIVLSLTGVDGSALEAKKMEALFGGFNETLPLRKLTFSGVSVRGCLAPLTKSFRFFPNLRELNLGGFNEEFNMDEQNLCLLLESLRFIPNLKTLSVKGRAVSQAHCCTAEVNPITSVAHNVLKQLHLDRISLTPAAAAALGRSLPEMSSLKVLMLSGVDGSILEAKKMEALFGGFNKTLPLRELTFSNFSVRGCLAPLTKSFRFFPNLRELNLGGFSGEFKMGEQSLCLLLESLRFIPNLKTLSVKGKLLREAHCCTAEVNPIASVTHKTLEQLSLDGISLTSAIAAMLGRLLPEMSSLQELELTGVNGSILEAKELEALFGGFNKTLPLRELTFRSFSVRGCLTPLTKSFRFFPYLRELNLGSFHVDEHILSVLLENLKFTPNLKTLSVEGKPLTQVHCCTAEVHPIASVTLKNLKKLSLDGISLTTAVAAMLSQSLPEMSFLEVLKLTGVDESILEAKELEKLFDGFNKTLPLSELSFSGFSVRGCLAPFTKSFRFFPNLRELQLGGSSREFSVDEQNLFVLLESLRFIPYLKRLIVKVKLVSQANCCATEVNPIASVALKTLEHLSLDGISLTPAVAAVLGRLLPEMSSLEVLKLTGVDGRIFEAKEMEALFGGLNKTLPLSELTFSAFSVRGCLAPLSKSLQFFPNLRELNLEKLNMDGNDLCGLLNVLCCTAKANQIASVTHKTLEQLRLDGISLTPAAAAALGRSLPDMSSLEVLKLTGVDGSILEAKEMEVLFGGFNKTLPLSELTFSGFSVRGCLSPLTKSLQFFPNLRELNLKKLDIDEHDLCGLLNAHCCRAEESLTASVTLKTLKTLEQLSLDGISLTPAAATALGQSLPEMSFLEVLKLTGVDGSILEAKEMEVLFGGFNKTLPLGKLTFSGFSVRGCLAPLAESLQSFPNLRELNLEKLDMDEHDLAGLLESLQFIPDLCKLNLSGNPLGHAVRYIVPHVSNLLELEYLWIDQTGHSEDDLNYVRDTVQQTLPELKIKGGHS